MVLLGAHLYLEGQAKTSKRLGFLELATITDDHARGSLARVGADSFDGLDDIQTLDNMPKHYMFPIEPWGSSSTQEEL